MGWRNIIAIYVTSWQAVVAILVAMLFLHYAFGWGFFGAGAVGILFWWQWPSYCAVRSSLRLRGGIRSWGSGSEFLKYVVAPLTEVAVAKIQRDRLSMDFRASACFP